MDSRRGINKTNELIIKAWKNAFIIMKIIFIPQEIFDRFRLALDKNKLIRKFGFRDFNFKGYLYAESITFILIKS
jgi:hypothetical protein